MLGDSDNVTKLAVKDITSTGRKTIGSKGIGTNCIGACIASSKNLILTVSNGCGKYTPCEDFTTNMKGSKGQVVTEKTTHIQTVTPNSYLVHNNKLIKLGEKTFSVKGKNSIGAKI